MTAALHLVDTENYSANPDGRQVHPNISERFLLQMLNIEKGMIIL